MKPRTGATIPTGAARRTGVMTLAGVVLAAVVLAGQSSPRAAILEQAGWDAIKAGRAGDAVDAFREAIKLDPRNAMLRLGAGTAEFIARHDPEARAYLEQALDLDPKLTRARAQLAQVYYRQGDLQEAIRLYDVVATEVPDDAGVRETLERWIRERDLHERMRLEVGDHFTVSFEGAQDAAMASQALDSLDRAFWRICDVFGVFPPKTIPVVLYSGEQFRDVTRSPQWAAAAYDGTIRVPMQGAGEQGDDLDRVLAHEFAHALIRSMATRGLPTWLNEGLASALESGSRDWAAKGLSEAARVPSLDQLTPPFSKLSGGDAQVAYAASAMAAKRLLDQAGGPAVANLLRDLGDGVSLEDAFLHRIGKSLADFQASLQ